jgi:hypothetical protein
MSLLVRPTTNHLRQTDAVIVDKPRVVALVRHMGELFDDRAVGDRIVEQASMVHVLVEDVPTFLPLVLSHDADPIPFLGESLPGHFEVSLPNGDVGELALWMTDGRVDFLEYRWYSDERPDEWPTPDQVSYYPEDKAR